MARVIHAVEQAQGSRAPTQRFVDRFAAIYTPAVFVLALAVAIAGPWLFGWAALAAVYKALVLLVIACPCALVISTPVTVVSGLASAARRGIEADIDGAPALAQADIAMAMGAAGTDIAMEAADVVVMNDDLRRMAETVRGPAAVAQFRTQLKRASS